MLKQLKKFDQSDWSNLLFLGDHIITIAGGKVLNSTLTIDFNVFLKFGI
jgi:hypothetical protein